MSARPPGSDALGPRRADREVEVWVVDLDDPRWPLARLEAVLTADERRRAARLASHAERARRVVARGVLRVLLAEREGTRPERVRIRRSAFGKPEIAGARGAGALRFSLSRSGGVALVALARGRRVGVDVEALRPVADRDEVARRMLSPAALAELEALAPRRRHRAFLEGWTRAEAYLKARGDGLLRTARLSLEPDGDGPARVAAADGARPEGEWSVADLRVPGHAAAVAAEGTGWRAVRRSLPATDGGARCPARPHR